MQGGAILKRHTWSTDPRMPLMQQRKGLFWENLEKDWYRDKRIDKIRAIDLTKKKKERKWAYTEVILSKWMTLLFTSIQACNGDRNGEYCFMSGCLSSDDFLSSKKDDESSAIVSSTGLAWSLLELPWIGCISKHRWFECTHLHLLPGKQNSKQSKSPVKS